MKHSLKISSFIFFAAIIASVSTSCGNDSELFIEDSSSLDINLCVPLTRSSPQEINDGHNPYSYRNVPYNENECMLNAIIQIAVKKGKRVFNNRINSTYTAASAYKAVRDYAMDYFPEDDPNYEAYKGGPMTASLAAICGKASGILEGNTILFDSYTSLHTHISNSEWKEKHENGTYIVSSVADEHASVCNGVNNKNEIEIYSAQYKSGKIDPEVESKYYIIY